MGIYILWSSGTANMLSGKQDSYFFLVLCIGS